MENGRKRPGKRNYLDEARLLNSREPLNPV
jgi:hypothetical protein